MFWLFQSSRLWKEVSNLCQVRLNFDIKQKKSRDHHRCTRSFCSEACMASTWKKIHKPHCIDINSDKALVQFSKWTTKNSSNISEIAKLLISDSRIKGASSWDRRLHIWCSATPNSKKFSLDRLAFLPEVYDDRHSQVINAYTIYLLFKELPFRVTFGWIWPEIRELTLIDHSERRKRLTESVFPISGQDTLLICA